MTSESEARAIFGDEPLARPDRIAGLDVTRGFAVMGILAMNIVAFAMPENAYITPRAWGGDTGPDLWVWAFNYVLLDSKMRGLFSMMFGASTLLVMQSALAAGGSPARTHYGRMIVLALFGLAHFFLIWFGDILFLYAGCGMLLYFFRNIGVRWLAIWGAVMTVLSGIVFGGGLLALSLGQLPTAPAEARQQYAAFAASFTPDSKANAEQIELYRSGFAAIASEHLTKRTASPFIGVAMYGVETLGLMLIGMALFKSGLLRGEWTLERLARWRNVTLGIGIAANLGLLWWQLAADLEPALVMASTFGLSVPFDVLMSIGYACLFMGLAQRFATSPLIARFAAVGRAAFTNYLGTSILMTALFYGWGLGQFGYWSRIEIYGPVLAVWVLMLLWSKPWLDRYRYGPLEWLWRSLAKLRVQPMRK